MWERSNQNLREGNIMWERMLADAKKVGADTILFRLYDGHDWKYQNHIVAVYFLCGDFEECILVADTQK